MEYVKEVSAEFDAYWNHELAVPAEVVFKAVDEVLETLKVLIHIFAGTARIDDISGISSVFDHIVFCFDFILKIGDMLIKRFFDLSSFSFQLGDLSVNVGHTEILLLLEFFNKGDDIFDIFFEGIFFVFAISDFLPFLSILFQFTIYTFCPLFHLFGHYLT